MKKVFSCTRCGFCCHGETTVSLDPEDQEVMLRTLKISREEALQKCWRMSGAVIQMQTVNGHCIFYKDGCSIHQARPKKCREWPLVRAIVTDETNLKTIRSSCSGISPSAAYADICQAIENGGCRQVSTEIITSQETDT